MEGCGECRIVFFTILVLHAYSQLVPENNNVIPNEGVMIKHKVASQCFLTSGNPVVRLDCEDKRSLIRVDSAVHGMHSVASEACSLLADDCHEDQMRTGFYDWSVCLGHSHCDLSVKHNWLASCGGYSTYVHVTYSCVPGELVESICSPGSVSGADGFIGSPGYPQPPAPSTDCQCEMVVTEDDALELDESSPSPAAAAVSIRLYSLALQQEPQQQCTDWLMVDAQQNGRRRMTVECGRSTNLEVNLEAPILLHFHTDGDDVREQEFPGQSSIISLNGFWLHYKVLTENTNVTLTCKPTKPKKLISRKEYLAQTVSNHSDSTVSSSNGTMESQNHANTFRSDMLPLLAVLSISFLVNM